MTTCFDSLKARVFFIAEAGVNHNGDIGLAKALCDIARDAGADAVKFQTFKADRIAASSAQKVAYQNTNDPTGDESQQDMLARLELSQAEFVSLRQHCADIGIDFMSTPFDEASADFLAGLALDVFKVSSGDLTHLPFLAHLARFGRPMIISTGMATLGEVEDAVRTIEANGAPPLAILHCVSNYPAAPGQANLRAMGTLADAFGYPVGWSDHTEGSAIAIASIATGARIIEKHFTSDRSLPGPDHKASLEPDELAELVRDVRKVEAALGDGIKRPTVQELDTATGARRSIIVTETIAGGETFSSDNLAILRPSTGLAPKHWPDVQGRTAGRTLSAGEPLTWDALA